MEHHNCYFCEKEFLYCQINEVNNIKYCDNCEMILNINSLLSIQNNIINECCVCLENKLCIKLPNCIHTLCLECFKSIYLGYNNTEKPIDYNINSNHNTTQPFNLNDDLDNDPERIKMEEYDSFEETYYDYNKTYEELTNIRNNLINTRPNWMNTNNFIDWENKNIQYWINAYKFDCDINNWEFNKTINARPKCPYCRQ